MTIEVTYESASTSWGIIKLLKRLEDEPLLSFDTEVAGLYSKAQRKEASKLLKDTTLSPSQRTEYSLVASNSGLSYPSLVNTTHFIFGLSESHSIVLVTPTRIEEMIVWNWLKTYKGQLRIWNALFDLKIMYHRVKAFPLDYIDGMLLAKCLINNADNFKSLVGLKEIMGSYYKPAWSLLDVYEPENLLDEDFMMYAATDGAATYYALDLINETLGVEDEG